MTELEALAQNLARNTTWHVFPCSESKAPCIGRKEGGKGCLDATREPETIRRLFVHRSAALIGIATGEISGFDALDVDVKHNVARAWMIRARDRIPSTRTYQTRSGGFHLLFRHAAGVHNTESHIAKGIDTRGAGGYVICWYAAGFPCTDESPIAEWPDWLLEGLFYKPEPGPVAPAKVRPYRSNGNSAQNLVAAAIRQLESAPEGSRHATLRAAACTLGGVMDAAGMSRSTATRLLMDAVLAAGGARVDRANAEGTIGWGLDKGAASPIVLVPR
jgi:Bifunctional DNA primase/polymerase, N-terminal